jgi:hypothetical protein
LTALDVEAKGRMVPLISPSTRKSRGTLADENIYGAVKNLGCQNGAARKRNQDSGRNM